MIGGGFPISVQTMWKEPLGRFKPADLDRIKALASRGCELLRFSVPDFEAVAIVGKLAAELDLPLVADIHFNHRLALACMDYPIAKIRINPGNIGASWKVEEILRKAAAKDIPLRIGVNAASLPKILRNDENKARAMLRAAEMEMEILDQFGFNRVIFSLKSSDIDTTVKANLLFYEKYDYPLHLGLTEAGPLVQGIVKSTLALSRLLQQGVGDTIRISLSDSPQNEVLAGRSILQSTGIRTTGVDIVSCPTCSRRVFDVKNFLEDIQDYIQLLDKNISLAFMGCPVNGPGEAREADLGVTGAGVKVVFFKQGRIIRRVKREEAVAVFKEEVDKL
ncbi:4-hydroxy-3-methylbut-2-en-1-yl diphosphate synthase (flavodoxin) [subsurface metagenome]